MVRRGTTPDCPSPPLRRTRALSSTRSVRTFSATWWIPRSVPTGRTTSSSTRSRTSSGKCATDCPTETAEVTPLRPPAMSPLPSPALLRVPLSFARQPLKNKGKSRIGLGRRPSCTVEVTFPLVTFSLTVLWARSVRGPLIFLPDLPWAKSCARTGYLFSLGQCPRADRLPCSLFPFG